MAISVGVGLDEEFLAQERGFAEGDILTQRCTLEQVTIEPAGYGARTRTPETVAHDVPCSVQPASRPRDSEEGERPTERAEWEVLLPYDQEVRIGWRIRVVGPAHEGQVYEVVGSDAGAADLIFITALCTKIKA